MTFFNEKEPYGDVLVYDMLREGQTKIQFHFTKNDNVVVSRPHIILKVKESKLIAHKITENKQSAKQYYDRATRKLKELQIGQAVVVRVNPIRKNGYKEL